MAREAESTAHQTAVRETTTGIEVRPVQGRAELRRFIRLPWSIYKDAPQWTPPLMSERKRHLDRKHNPFFDHAEAEYFIAYRDGRPVGRITAHVDHRLNEYQGVKWGLFGFFESENDPAVSGALLSTAEAWLSERDVDQMVGPMDFNTNHECGLLVEGHEWRPQILENWHHPYYAALIEGYGLTKTMDLLKWKIDPGEKYRVLPVIYELAERLEEEHGIRLRHMKKRNLRREIRYFLDIYNSSWTRNWGFVPLTDAEVDSYAKELKPILDEKWAVIAEKSDGTPVGVGLTLYDYNRVLAAVRTGRLLPFGWLRALRAQRKLDEIRVFALGVKPDYRHTGVAAAMYVDVWETVVRDGVKHTEQGWILETNEPMNRAMEALGGDIHKRYRVYEKPLREPATH